MIVKNTVSPPAQRNVSLDLLKISAMFLVVLIHCTSHGLKGAQIVPLCAVDWVSKLVNSFSMVAVNCFVLVSGYFLSAKEPNPKKLIPLWLQVFSYSVGIFLILCLIPESGIVFSLKGLLGQCLPLMSQQYWFFTFYFLMYLLAPYLNRLVGTLSQKDYRGLLFVCLILFSVIPSMNPFGDSFKVNSGYSLTWFLVLYLVAGYTRRFPPAKKPWGWGYILPCLLLGVLRVLAPVMDSRIPFFSVLVNKNCTYNAPIIFLASLCLFLWALTHPFKGLPKVRTVIPMLSSLTFGVYLLHDHGSFSPVLWNKIVKMQESVHFLGAFLPRLLIASVAIFLCGIAAEWGRRCILKLITNLFKR